MTDIAGDEQRSGPKSDIGVLWVVAVPLGNPADLSPRAVGVLRSADVILAEDTRSARRLLADAGAAEAQPRVLSCFDGNEGDRATEAVARVAAGQIVALVSEAGTPLVSDPGYRVVAAVVAAGLRVRPLPGPSALLAALVVSALPPDRFTFLGFPPRKSSGRRRLFQTLRDSPFTLVLYESPLRTADTLADLAAVLGADRPACLARELTKPFEEIVRGSLSDLVTRYQDQRPLGEVTLVVGGASEAGTADEVLDAGDADLVARVTALLEAGQSARDVVATLTQETGRPRREVYAVVNTIVASR